MNKDRGTVQASKWRQKILRVYQGMASAVKVLLKRKPLYRGVLYELKTRCGKPGCRCTRGELHRKMVLTLSEQGKHRLISPREEELPKLKLLTDNYRRFRQARAQVMKINKEIVKLADSIEQELLKQGKRYLREK